MRMLSNSDAPPSTCVALLMGHTLEAVLKKRGYVVQ
jgi:hypothetical protein